MNGYIVNFATYIFAMIGFIVICLLIYKKAMCMPMNIKNKSYLQVENSLKLSPSKTIYVLKAGSERFLIAGDNTNTTMLAKLDESNIYEEDTKVEKISDFKSIKESIMKMNRG